MVNKKALKLIELGLNPVLLGSSGDDLKRPLLKGWQTAVYTATDVHTWPPRNNIGIRCGRQLDSLPRASRGGRCLLVFDFDEEAGRVFPLWRAEATGIVGQEPVIVSSGRGYHVYLFTPDEMGSRTLAGRRVVEDGRTRLQKFIETIGRHKQVVAAGGRHPLGRRYRFAGPASYADIPIVTVRQLSDLTALARAFDERPAQTHRPPHNNRGAPTPPGVNGDRPAGVQDCLEYARRFIGVEERVERNGDIRFLGYGGLLVTADGRGWYSFSDETGGGLAELIAWRQSLVGEG